MKKNYDIVEKVIHYMEENLDEELTLDTISKHVGYSKFHLNRIFTEVTGYTMHKFIQSRRLYLAARKLTTTTTPIAQIALEAGYHSQQAFTLAFRQIYQYPPQTYRKLASTVLSVPSFNQSHAKQSSKISYAWEVLAA
ncbi:helix-turn-helix domain-containing protein [Candidatus Galacturonibacter soehngenii]|nr:AraC family transcriptional regulator [Candidatus Galacturonibacter soehngenii]